jgi:hypothetical protein
MNRLLAAGCLFFALFGRAVAAEGSFSSTVSPEELAATGLAGLTPAQLARIDALVDAYRSGSLAVARRTADEAVAAKRVAEARLAAANAEAAKSASLPNSMGGTKELPKTAGPKKSGGEPIESSLMGNFEGWGPRQIFTLANGQRWQVANNESYYSSPKINPRVLIVPAAFAGYWLRFPDLGAEVRVVLLGDR